MACPVINMRVLVEGVSMGVTTSIPMLSACVSQCLSKAVAKAGTSLMEPVMSIEVCACIGGTIIVASGLLYLNIEARLHNMLAQSINGVS